jgi:uncharacterized membrane protein YjgN (DUF898 family)
MLDLPLADPSTVVIRPEPDEWTAASARPAEARPFAFTGTAGEYFRIWIVNLALSVVTLGLYSAWAKVRRLRYFYGHTLLDGSRFGYHASPVAILKGRLIAYAVIGVVAIFGQLAPLVGALLYFPLLVLMPVLIVRALRFHAVNSSYRGIRFGFDGTVGESYAVFLGWMLLVPFTFGLLYPFVVKRQREFVVVNSRHGRTPFQLSLGAGAVYVIYAVAAVAGLVWMMLAIGLAIAAAVAFRSGPNPPPYLFLVPLSVYAGFGVIAVGVRTVFENLVWDSTTIDGHMFRSRLTIGRMLALYTTNLLAIAGTLGLAVPWARVRLARYRAESLVLLPVGPLVSEAAIADGRFGATGSEFSEAMDFDVGL